MWHEIEMEVFAETKVTGGKRSCMCGSTELGSTCTFIVNSTIYNEHTPMKINMSFIFYVEL